MKLEDIMATAEQDGKIDYTEIGTESLNTTNLVVKWLKIYSLEKLTYLKLKRQFDGTKKEKWEYYSGKGDKPFELRLLKTDIPIYLDNDPDLASVREKIETQEVKLNFIEGFVKALHSRGFNIKTAFEYQKFTSGAN